MLQFSSQCAFLWEAEVKHAEPLCGWSTEIYGRAICILDYRAGSAKLALGAPGLLYTGSCVAACIAQISEGIKIGCTKTQCHCLLRLFSVTEYGFFFSPCFPVLVPVNTPLCSAWYSVF